ncbi:hypothetical protein MTR67_030401 [Solanum verrucosum]|uniref:Reverse transcriptase domain-containing protein n=1 Tax=Solanum verrucosum TaxID=315347 RepID=A0AAF0RDW5_SOLVR|nr:hypothetical protein MTR67_030401 [Solanum verrucosum]
MREFSDFIEDMGLIDLQMENATFTWYKGDNHEVASRIDRILFSKEWEESFNDLKVIPLQRIISDHVPLALQGGTWNKNKRYFKFENWWLDTEGFTDRVKDWWNKLNFGGRPDYVLACKMISLKNKLKEWSREVQGNLGIQRKKLLEKLADFDFVVTTRPLSEEESTRKEGTINIDQLEVEGEITQDTNKIEKEVIDFYQRLYTETSQWRPTSNIPNCPVISSEEKEILQRNFEEDEVLRCLKLCAMDKAPGPDGFTMDFYIKCWEIVKHDIMKAFQNFHEQEVLERSFNATFIALIPKKKGSTELRDFIYKIFSKVLTERLKGVMEKLVDSHQMAFIKGRQIMDAVLVANEAVGSRMKWKKAGILCKLDIEKAYDHVN